MREPESPLAPETEDAVFGASDNEDAETLASVRRGIADVVAGRSQNADEAFDKLEARYAA